MFKRAMIKRFVIYLNLCMIFICLIAQGQNNNDVLIPLAKDTAHASSGKLKYTISKLAEGSFSNPLWSPDGQMIAFTNKGQSGIMVINKEGGPYRTLTDEMGAGYKFVWSMDNEYIAYRATRFDGNKRMQFVEIVSVKDTTKSVLFKKNGIQPPVWQYTEKGKRVAYVSDKKVLHSDYYPYASEAFKSVFKLPNINMNLYYKSGRLYMINDAAALDEASAVEGMDAVISPDHKRFIYKHNGKLCMRSFDNDTVTVLGKGSHPSWSPDGSKIVFELTTDDGHTITTADLYIMNLSSLESYPLTETKDSLEVNPSWSPDGKSIVYNDENDGTIYLLIFN